MSRKLTTLCAASLLAIGACSDNSLFPDGGSSADLSAAFSGVPIGFDNTSNTFGDSLGTSGDWLPGDSTPGGRHHRRRGRGPGGPGGPGGGPAGGLGGMMCGGIGGPGHGFDFGFGHGGFRNLPSTCVFNPSSGRVECDTTDRHGLDVVRSIQFKDALGAIQQAYDSATTDYVNIKVDVSGTATRRHGATSTVQHNSDRTITGLAPASTQRTINGTSAGNEVTSGTNDSGVTFTSTRIIGDTVTNVVIPKGNPGQVYPISGSVIRSLQVTLVVGGGTPVVNSRREVVTYDGSATAQIVITRNGETRTCTMPLPRGPLTCS